MRLQKLFKEAPEKPEELEPFASWKELSPQFEQKNLGDCILLIAKIEDSSFDNLVGVFQSKEEAMGAFLTLAMEHGWEEVPQSYCIYHAQEVDGKLVAGLLFNGQVNTYEQTTVEQMVQVMAKVHRVVVYFYDVVTYIKDIYPEIDKKVFIISRNIARLLGTAPEMEELAMIYGMALESLEDRLRLIKKLLDNPVRTPYGEVELPHFSYPVEGCEGAQ